jgi:predicted RNA-binding Zn-ribbon protein involved in translation (DUF1610 family)
MTEESGKIERYYDSDFVKFVFTVEDGSLTNISIEIKEGAPYPKIDLEGVGRANIWFGMLRENIEQGLFHAPTKRKSMRVPGKPIVDQAAISVDESSNSGKKAGTLICPDCGDVELVEKEECCGKRTKRKTLRYFACPECGGRFRIPVKINTPTDDENEGFEGVGRRK